MKSNNYLLLSPSNILIDKEIANIINEKGYKDASITIYDLEETDLATVLEDLDTVSFLTPLKVVIANHAAFLGSGSAEEEKSINHLLKYLDQEILNTLFFLTVNKIDDRKKIGKELKKKMTFLELNPSKDSYIKTQLAGYKLENGVIPNIISRVNDNYDMIYQECDKLKLYKIDTKEITNQDVDFLLPIPLEKQDQLSFDLIKAIGMQNKKEALLLYNQLKNYDIEILPLMGLLESQYRLLYQVKLLNNKGYKEEDIAKEMAVHPYRVKKILELGRYSSLKDIKRFILELADLDLKLKTGQADKDIAMEMLILNG
mgnify:FL=1